MSSIVTRHRKENAVMAPVVAEDIRKMMHRDRRFARIDTNGLNFLMSMGLTVSDPGERVALLAKCARYALMESQ